MTWTISISGHDSLAGDEKSAYENDVVAKAQALVTDLAGIEGGTVTTAIAVTNTTSTVSLDTEPPHPHVSLS